MHTQTKVKLIKAILNYLRSTPLLFDEDTSTLFLCYPTEIDFYREYTQKAKDQWAIFIDGYRDIAFSEFEADGMNAWWHLGDSRSREDIYKLKERFLEHLLEDITESV